jgi:hypothetical protein
MRMSKTEKILYEVKFHKATCVNIDILTAKGSGSDEKYTKVQTCAEGEDIMTLRNKEEI